MNNTDNTDKNEDTSMTALDKDTNIEDNKEIDSSKPENTQNIKENVSNETNKKTDTNISNYKDEDVNKEILNTAETGKLNVEWKLMNEYIQHKLRDMGNGSFEES